MDILIIGGGIIGLSVAVALAKSQKQVGIIDGGFTGMATTAAAGMLAPGAEQLPPGPMRDFCQASLKRYPAWIEELEHTTGQSTGYWPCGILAPADTPEPGHHTGIWIDRQELEHQQPGLGEQFVGAWWYPDNGQVDNRRLTHVLRQAAQSLGVQFFAQETVVQIVQAQGRISHLMTHQTAHHAEHYILATGAWTHKLLNLPVYPRKGQMLALQIPSSAPRLQHVIFGPAYLVPRQDGHLIIGATSEDVGFQDGVTASGLHTLLQKAMATYPLLQNWPVVETWWGYRPLTPDECPILGPSPWPNLTFATGHYRNGILLAPITAEVISNHLNGNTWPETLNFCRWERFGTSVELL
ncbi:MAG: glycine oxidase ThiO [Gloeomargarita sp. SKYB31]|nr:glycine oxidase ThiO [Gloeomargarita sp. SKYB31]